MLKTVGITFCRAGKLRSMFLRLLVCMLASVVTNSLLAEEEHSPSANSESSLHPLASKEEMIRDRFQRFQDRVFRLREQIAEKEPQNAARLGRALSQAGELELMAKLDALVKALRDPAQLPQTADAQAKWMEDADRLLNILLEQDSQNKERRDELDKLKEYQKKLNEILSQEQGLRNQSGETVEAKRMAAQLDQAIKRVDALIKRQDQLSQASQSQTAKGEQGEKSANGEKGAKGENVAKGDEKQGNELGEQQKDLAKDTERLAEDLKQLGEKSDSPTDSAEQPQSSQLDAARAMTQSASQSAQSGSQSMSQAGEKLSENKQADASQSQKSAEESLQETKKQLEEAKNALQQKPSGAASGAEQKSVAQSTKSLSNQMQQDAQSSEGQQGQQGKQGGKSGKSGKSSSKSQSAQQQLDQAEKSMDDAAESLDKDSPEKAIPPQDDALDKLSQAKKELEEQIQKLRKEEKDETLRDLEARFRDMLSKQKPINDATVSLNDAGRANFKRADELQLADMSVAQRGIAGQARTCLHILDEEGTTVAFPRVVNQLAEDMDSVADRLKGLDTGAITQTVEQEIIDTLTQLLDAVKKMQQENSEQAKSGGSQGGGDKNPPLLPPSAELKLLKASQVRINTRTTTIAGSLESGSEPKPDGEKGLKVLANRQQECMDIARQMKDKAEQP